LPNKQIVEYCNEKCFSVFHGLTAGEGGQPFKSEMVRVEKQGTACVLHSDSKNKGTGYLDISDQARKCLGHQGNPDDRVFVGLKYSGWHNIELQGG